MKLLILLLYINTFVLGEHILSNYFFQATIDENKIILNEYDVNNSVIIKYDNIKFNYSSIGYTDFDYTKSIMNTNSSYLKIINKMKYNITNSYNNYLNVSIYIKNINELVLCFNKPINYDGKYYLEINNYIIIFSENATVDRFGNYFYINFTNDNQNDIYYNFIIKYNYKDIIV